MRWLLGIAVALALVAGGAPAAREAGLWGDEAGDARLRLPRIDVGGLLGGEDSPLVDRDLSGSACRRLAALASLLALEELRPQEFVRRLGREAAGIHSGARGLADLARGGGDLIPGKGFRGRYSDGSNGQARHFAGIAVAATYGGEQATRLVSIFARRDRLNSADGRLTEAGLAFTRMLEGGELAVADAGAWIADEICKPKPAVDTLLP